MNPKPSLLVGDDRWAPRAVAPPLAATVADVLATAVALWPERTAFVCVDEEVTYADVAGLAARAAHRLRAAGVGRGGHVVIWMANSADFLGWYFGTAQIGATLVPLHTRSTAREAAALFATTPPAAFIVGDGEGAPRAAEVGEVLRHPALAERGVPVLDGRIGESPLPPHAASAARPDDTFLIKFTSGSSSAPKGVRLSHGSIVRNAFHAGTRLGLTTDDVFFSPMPFYHVAGSVLTILTVFTHGATIVTLRRFDPDAAIAAIRDHRCSAHIGMDIMYLKEARSPLFSTRAIASLRTGWIAAAPDAASRVYAAMPFPFVNLYGMTEMSANVCMTAIDDPPELRLGWAGVPQPGLEAAVFEPGADAIVPVGSPGEIRVHGWAMMQGYMGDRETPVDEAGWLRTGDRGLVGENGYLQFNGRLRETLKVGGENVSCAEVEAALAGHAAVAIAQVVGIPDEVYGELPVAFVQLDSGATAEELLVWCRTCLAGFKVPRHVFFVTERDWPMTGPEKISRPGLRALAAEFTGNASTHA